MLQMSGRGGKQAKKQLKTKKKEQVFIIDLEDELHKFVNAQKTENEGHKEMLEAQRCVSTENPEAQKLAYE
jgi:type I site-specific restriction endonuclease